MSDLLIVITKQNYLARLCRRVNLKSSRWKLG